MSGHSKWASIKHKKAIVDSRRGKLFTKLARAITTAAREGGGELEGNPALQLAVQKARDASMPKDNIERAIAKGTGAGADAAAIEDVMYEGYGPGGVAMLIEAMTENRNRTGADVRHVLGKYGGSLGEPGTVAYLFDKRGLIVVDGERYSEDDLMPAIEAGAEDISDEEGVFEVLTEPALLTPVRSALTDAGVEIESAELAWLPKVRVPVEEDDAAKLMRLIDALEDNDDVDAVHANFDIDADVLERATADLLGGGAPDDGQLSAQRIEILPLWAPWAPAVSPLGGGVPGMNGAFGAYAGGRAMRRVTPCPTTPSAGIAGCGAAAAAGAASDPPGRPVP
ncbi:MAG: hypothetical protein QOG94_2108 [Solirubrobacteraceae bacterium]|nr:hypothetical protein [Solirubrobacteraceae bacterium]